MKYIKCDNCGKKIYFGKKVWNDGCHCGVYCSAKCFAENYGGEYELDKDFADNCMCEVHSEKKSNKDNK